MFVIFKLPVTGPSRLLFISLVVILCLFTSSQDAQEENSKFLTVKCVIAK